MKNDDPRTIDDEWIAAYLRGEVCLPSHGRLRHFACWLRRCMRWLRRWLCST